TAVSFVVNNLSRVRTRLNLSQLEWLALMKNENAVTSKSKLFTTKLIKNLGGWQPGQIAFPA
ncbi:MAG: hypothetical protein Q8N96_10330, partial [Methylovulum sp.]|nr:hypothetical protein [Methylovulum sp.]